MQKRVFGPVFAVVRDGNMTIRWKPLPLIFVFAVVFLIMLMFLSALIWFYGELHHWFPRLPYYPMSWQQCWILLPIMFVNLAQITVEKLTFRQSNFRGVYKTAWDSEEFDFSRAEVAENGKRFALILHQPGDKPFFSPRMLRRFRTEDEARKMADFLDAFFKPPAETPGVWPPPPRVPGATHG